MNTIRLLVYSSDDELRKRLLRAISAHTHRCLLETFADIRALNYRLQKNASGEIWLVLVTANHAELDRFSAMGELIQNIRSILVLPDQHRETIFVGHTLYPRFISYLDSDFSDVGSVLGTVIRNNSQNTHKLISGGC